MKSYKVCFCFVKVLEQNWNYTQHTFKQTRKFVSTEVIVGLTQIVYQEISVSPKAFITVSVFQTLLPIQTFRRDVSVSMALVVHRQLVAIQAQYVQVMASAFSRKRQHVSTLVDILMKYRQQNRVQRSPFK